MLKGMCFSLPSVSIDNALQPVARQIATADYQVRYYNTEAFRSGEGGRFTFKAYPGSYQGYQSDTIDDDISYFRFGHLLADTAVSLIDFLMEEVQREYPDFILHSHLAIWGKLVARYYRLPAVSLFSTFVMDERIMQPQLQKLKRGNGPDLASLREGKGYYRKMQALHDRLGLTDAPNIWDAYINREKLNVSLILGDLQPHREIIPPDFKFVGFPVRAAKIAKQPFVYISLGTVFNASPGFYNACIGALGKLNVQGIISVGSKISIPDLGPVPDSIQVAQRVDQVEVLGKAAVFVTHGGSASVQEAICTLTPMVVTPRITEQKLAAAQIEALGIGIHLPGEPLTEEDLSRAIRKILDNYQYYADNLRSLVARGGDVPASVLACNLISEYVRTEVSRSHVIK